MAYDLLSVVDDPVLLVRECAGAFQRFHEWRLGGVLRVNGKHRPPSVSDGHPVHPAGRPSGTPHRTQVRKLEVTGQHRWTDLQQLLHEHSGANHIVTVSHWVALWGSALWQVPLRVLEVVVPNQPQGPGTRTLERGILLRDLRSLGHLILHPGANGLLRSHVDDAADDNFEWLKGPRPAACQQILTNGCGAGRLTLRIQNPSAFTFQSALLPLLQSPTTLKALPERLDVGELLTARP